MLHAEFISFISVSHSEYLPHLEIAKLAKLHCSMDDLPEALLAEIVKRLTSPSDLKSLSLVSKRLYAVEGELRNSMYIGCIARWMISQSLEDLTLARVSTEKEIGLRCLLRKCKALKNLCLYYVLGVQDNDIVTLSNNCSNLTSISLRLTPEFNEGHVFRTSLTDDSLKALALRCRKLQSFELIFWGCDENWPEIGFTQEGLVMLIQSCPIRNLVLSGAHIFDDEGMKAISSAQFLESLELIYCINVTNAGMRLLAHCPCLINLTLRQCDRFSDAGVTEVARARKLETLVIEGCSRVSPEAVQGAATSVHYTKDYPGLFNLGRA